MARHEADREDLWAEAIALTSRAELSVTGQPRPVIVGYRDNGWCSLYFGQDLMLQFTPDGGLRRAFRHGELFRTQGTTLARLRRHRTETETSLLRHDLTSDELADFEHEVRARVEELLTALCAGGVTVQREICVGSEPILSRLAATLTSILNGDHFVSPAIPGKA
jgi:hypothetical protein